jgi:hypothetical protein
MRMGRGEKGVKWDREIDKFGGGEGVGNSL